MKLLLIGALLTVSLTVARGVGNGGYPKTLGQPWPMPQAYSALPTALVVDDTLTFTSNLPACDVIQQAFARYKPYITQADCARSKHSSARHASRVRSGTKLTTLQLNVAGSCEKWPSLTSDEQYSVTVNAPSSVGTAQIQAATIWGALRGLETFSQLVYDSGEGVLVVNTTQIQDHPRFNYRGLLLDTSRHFLPVRAILETLEAMAQNKLNVFHWHIVDDQSFPYVSTAFPDLSRLGAYGPEHVYSPKDVAEVIEFARVRGIRVIPEFDSPGHTLSWGPGQPGLLTPCYSGGKADGTFGPVNPTLNSTYQFLGNFFSEVAKVFPDPYLHLGGDEVSFDCWKSNPDVLSFMKAQGMGEDFSLLEEYYEQRVVDVVSGLDKKYIVWQEVFDNKVKLDKSAVIHVWKPGYQSDMAAVTKAGYQTILSAPWYLDSVAYGIDWPDYYKPEPLDFPGTEEQKKLVVGGGACMWIEFVDSFSVMARTWPRASAVAERLWSAQGVTDVNAAGPRLEEHRCRMMKRGLTVAPVNGPGFCTCDIFN